MSTHKVKLITWLISLSMVLACVVPSLATPLPPSDPAAIGTFIAQTVNAASTQTARVLPTSTYTPTTTPTPRNTDTPTPTATATVLFLLSSPTSLVIPTFTAVSSGGSGTGSGTSSENYACQVVSVSPANGTSLNARDDFDAVWKVKNIGQKNWDRNGVDYFYASGAKLHKVAGYDMNGSVAVGATTDIIVDMTAPKDSGSYSTTWNLKAGSKTFCNMSLRITVR
jgi:hypothetical protein